MELVKDVWKCLVSLFSIEKHGGMYIREFSAPLKPKILICFYSISDLVNKTNI